MATETLQEFKNRTTAELNFRDAVKSSTGKTVVSGTADFIKGYEDGRAGKSVSQGRAQYDNKAQKDDYTTGHSRGGMVKVWEGLRGKTQRQIEQQNERETNQMIAREYGFSDDAIKAIDGLLNNSVGQQFPTEG